MRNTHKILLANCAVFSLLFFISIACNDAIFISLYLMVALFYFTLIFRQYFIYTIITALPFTYMITVLFFNAGFFNNNFKIFAAIKFISLTIVPVAILLIVNFRNYKIDKLEYTIMAYLAICSIYMFIGVDENGKGLSNFMQMVPFVIFLILGKLLFLSNISLDKVSDVYVKLSIAIIFIGIIMYLLFDELQYLYLSPKAYAIQSVGMQEYQFIGEIAASSYSFIFYDSIGLLRRFFSIFYSGIGMAYFLAAGFFISLYRRNRLPLFIISVAIFATLTRAVWILVCVSPVAVSFIASKSSKNRLVAIMIICLSLLVAAFAYKNIIMGYFLEDMVSAYHFEAVDQSAAAHIISILVFYKILTESIFGYGMGFSSGESFLVDVFARTGIVGFALFFLIFIVLFKELRRSLALRNINNDCLTALCMLIFNFLGSLFSRESYTLIISYMSWIYIGYAYAKAVSIQNEDAHLITDSCTIYCKG